MEVKSTRSKTELTREALKQATGQPEDQSTRKRCVSWGFQTVLYFEQSPALEIHTPIPELTRKEEREQQAVVDLKEIFGEDFDSQDLQVYTRRRRRGVQDLAEEIDSYKNEELASTNLSRSDCQQETRLLQESLEEEKSTITETSKKDVFGTEPISSDKDTADSLEQEALFKLSLSTQEECYQDPFLSPKGDCQIEDYRPRGQPTLFVQPNRKPLNHRRWPLFQLTPTYGDDSDNWDDHCGEADQQISASL